MKKTLLVFLLSLVVFAGASFFVFEDAVNSMINIGGNYFDQLLGNTPDVDESSKPGDKPEEPEKHYDVLITEEKTNYRLEAEDLSIDNLIPDDIGAVEIEVWPHVTGLGHIAPGGYQTFTIKSDKDAIISLSLSFANASGGSILQYIPGALINGKAMRFLDAEVPKGTGTAKQPETYYWNLATLKIAEFNVEANVDYEIKMFINMGNLDAYIFDVLSEHVHVEETVAGYAATCTEAGLTDGKKCIVCGEMTVAQETIPAKGHTNVITPGYAATCTEAGLTDGKDCSVCGESVPQEVIPAIGHKDVDPQDGKCDVCATNICVNHNEVIDAAVEPTCTTDGKTEGKHCSVCGEVIVAQEVIKAEGHAYDDDLDANCNKCGEKREVKLATPDNSDDKLFYRANETYIEIDRAVDAAGKRVSMFGLATDYVVIYVYESADADKDDYVAQFKLYGYADHSNDGKINTSIATMDDSVTSKIIRGSDGNLYIHKSNVVAFYEFIRDVIGCDYRSGHTYHFAAQAIAKQGTAYVDSDVSEIGASGIAIQATALANGHTEETLPGKAATCTETGLTEGKKCSTCGKTLVEQEVIPAKGHTEETLASKEATCTETGLTEGKRCTVCKATLVAQEVIPAKGHTEETVAGKDATCTETGLTEGKKCTVCKATLVAQDVIPAKGHKDEAPKDYVCDVCNEDLCTNHVEVDDAAVEATCTETGLTAGKHCSICGEVTKPQEVVQAKGHTEEIVAGKEATCTETGLTEGKKCTVCKETLVAQNVIPAKGHTEETVAGKDATCTETGLTEGKKCAVCKETLVAQEEIAAKGHKYDNDQDVDCNVCGETRIVKLTTPDNSESKLLYYANKSYIEIDRAKDANGNSVSMFVEGTDHVLFYVYEAADADKADYVAQFKLYGYEGERTPNITTYIESVDGSISAWVIRNFNGDLYIYSPEYNQFYNFLRDIIGYNYSYGQTYYFAAQAVAAEGGNYQSSDISEIGANGFARDASKGTDKYTVTVENGTIDGERTTVTAGYGVELTLTVSGENEGSFKGWYLVDAEGNEIGEALSTATEYVYTVTENATVKAVFVVEKTKLATPDNSASKLLYYASASFIEIDRSGATMFVTGTDHVVFYVYESADADKADYVAQFKLYGYADNSSDGAINTSIATMDDSVSLKIIRGSDGNLYINVSEFNAFYDFLRDIIGYNYSYGQTYYFAAQAVAAEGTAYESSEISAIGANGFARDASKGTDKYTVMVENGTIDGERTTVTAGYGVVVNVAASAFENDEFACWKNVETGEIYSESETFALTVTSSLTLRAYGKAETQKIKLVAPDNSNNQMITFVVKSNTFYIEFDRQKNADGTADTAFDEGVAFIRYHMYRDITNEAGETEKQLVSHFDITSDGYVVDYSGATCSQKLQGVQGDFYSKMGNGTIHNWIKDSYVQGAQAKGLDITEWSANETHYFACQVISSNPDLYEDSDIGAMGKGHGSI